jgi:N12 class adenine-specific DNA methylase
MIFWAGSDVDAAMRAAGATEKVVEMARRQRGDVVYDGRPPGRYMTAIGLLDAPSVDAAAREAATSPDNDLPEPTEAQKEAGTYKKGHAKVAGLDLAIENPAGSKRRPEWPTLKSHYGYIKGTTGADKDHIDVFVKPGTPDDYDGPVFVVNQTKRDGSFDEHKVMLGFGSLEEAKAAYLENYTPGWKNYTGIASYESAGAFREWLKAGNTKRPAPVKTPQVAEVPGGGTAYGLPSFVTGAPVRPEPKPATAPPAQGFQAPPTKAKVEKIANGWTIQREEGSNLWTVNDPEGKQVESHARYDKARQAAKARAAAPAVSDDVTPKVTAARERMRSMIDYGAQMNSIVEARKLIELGAFTDADRAALVAKWPKLTEEQIVGKAKAPAGETTPESASSTQEATSVRPDEPVDGAPADDPEPLADAPAEDVPGPREGRAARASDRGGVQPDQGSDAGPASPEGPDRPGVGDGPRELGAPADRGGQPDARDDAERDDRAGGERGSDFRIQPGDRVGAGSLATKAKSNLAALRILKAVETEGRQATPEEQAKLVRYVGWGGMPQMFYGYTSDDWMALQREMRDILSPEEIDSARASTPNAHYTSPDVVSGMWEAVRRLGLPPGASMLEPASGVGHFLGLMPADLARGARRTAIELDAVTGRIAKLLYPRANVHVKGFEAVPLPDNFFDLAISNVPFGNYGIHDPHYKRTPVVTRSIHDYFFAKALDKVRPGGVVAFITSSFTMDKADPAVRKYLAERGDLVGAIRLPNTAFKGNAGTEVTTDIIFLKKRAPGEAPGGEAWLALADAKGKGGVDVRINEYFARHPEMMVGEMSREGSMYRSDEQTLEGTLTPEKLAAAVARLPEGVITPRAAKAAQDRRVVALELGEGDSVKEGAFTVKDGTIFTRKGAELVEAKLSAEEKPRVLGMVGVRDALRAVLRSQLTDGSDATVTAARKNLGKTYDVFVKKHGPLNDRRNARAFADDPDAPLLLSLENWDEDNKTATKADIFSKRTIQRYQPVERADAAPEALTVSLNETGRLDWDRMSKLTGKTAKDLQRELGPLVYENPEGDWETADAYLSGDVREKLRAAQEAARLEPEKFKRNVEALQKVQPTDLEPTDIDARLGAPWIPKEDIRDFIAETLDVPRHYVKVGHSDAIGTWTVELTDRWAESNINNTQTYGTPRVSAAELIEDALNQQLPTVRDRDGDKTVVNPTETLAAREKHEQLRNKFREWIWQNPDRADRLARKYNDEFNNLRLREFDGSHMTFPGMARLGLRGGDLSPHQKNAVWRILQHRGNTLLAHVVGAGKTFEMVAAGMELRRVGLAKKPIYVVPNHLVEQWGSEFLRLYPMANVLVLGKDHFAQGKRQKAMSKIATGNYDAIIVSHKSFEALPVADETFNSFLQEQIDRLGQVIDQARDEDDGGGRRGKKPTARIVKELEKAKKRLEAKLRKKADRESKDDAVTFEELGVDALFVDEAHAFKNLFFPSKLRVSGLPQTESNRAFDMFVKVQHLTRQNGGRGVVFATGTPVTNSMAEMFTLQRYLQSEYLEQQGLAHFDGWAGNFGETVTGIELAPDGSGYRTHTRFAKFVNLPELLSAFRTFADVKTAEDLNLPRPKVKGGKAETVAAPKSLQLEAYVASLVERADAVRQRRVRPDEDNMLAITGDGRRAALDMRLVDPNAEDDPHSKLNQAVTRVHDIWKATAAKKSTQLVFIDLSTPASQKERGKKFTAYDDIKAKLINAGVPEREIAFIHDADTDAKKLKLFNDVNAGKVRILLGSTEKMGAGTNVQKRLVALHHLDAPWRPSDIEQREGRILRQGNENPEVQIVRYVTQGSFDAYMWQTLETKSRFITQVMRGDATVRSAEDVEGGALTYAEVKAIASGNPEVMEKVKVDSEIRKLDTLRSAHARALQGMRRRIAALPEEIAQTERVLGDVRADEKAAAKTDGKDFSIKLGKATFDEKPEANDALKDLATGIQTKTTSEKVGEYRGFDVILTSYGSPSQPPSLSLRGRTTHYANVVGVGSLEHAVSNMDARAKELERAAAEKRQQLDALKKEADKPFEHEAKLRALTEKQKALEAKLDLDKSDQQAAGDEGAPGEPTAEGGLSGMADAARERLKKRGGQANSEGTAIFQGGATLADLAIIGADYMAKGLKRFGAWSRAMLKEFGAGIRSALRRVFGDASKVFRTHAPKAAAAPARPAGAPPVPPSSSTAKPAAPAGKGLDIDLGKETTPERLERYWIDSQNRVKKLMAAVRAAGGKVTDDTDIAARKKLFDSQTNHQLDEARQRFQAPLLEVLRKHGILPDELKKYLLAKHAPAANRIAQKRVGAKSAYGMTDAEAAAHLAGLEPRRRAQLEEAAALVRKITAEQRRVMRDSGLVSAEEIAQWEAKFGPDYVPVKTFDDDPLLQFIATGDDLGRHDVLGHESKMRLAQEEMPDDPVAFALHGLERTIVRANKNRLAQDLAKLIRENPSKFWGIDREHRKPAGERPDGSVKFERDHIADLKDLHYKVGGKTHRISIDDPVVMAQLKGNDKQTGEFLRTVAKATRFWSGLVTKWSPEFILTNPLRDIQQVLASAGVEHGKDAVKRIAGNVRHAVLAMYRLNSTKGDAAWKKVAQEFMEDGGLPEAYVVRDPKKISAELRGHVTAGTWKRSAQAAKQWVETANRAMEGGIRLAVYKAMRDAGKTRQEAAVIARQMGVDFAQKGEAGPAINALYAFFNANLQGTKRLYEVLNSKRGAALGATLVGAGVAVDMLNRALAGDDDEDGRNDYDQIPEYVKERNLIIPNLVSPAHPLMVPLPWGYNVVFNTGRMMSAAAHGAMDPKEAAGHFAAGLVGAFNPVGSEETLEQILSPTLLDPVVQLSTNKTFAGKPIAPENRFGQQKPDSELSFRNASKGSKAVAKMLNGAFGGDEVTSSGWTDISPNSIDHAMSWAFGGAGRFLGQVTNVGAMAARGEMPTTRDVPGVRRVIYTESPGAVSGRYQENASLLDKEWARYQHYRQTKNTDAMKSVPLPLIRAKRAFDRYDADIRALNKRARERDEDVEDRVRRLQVKANRIVEAARRAPAGGK